MERGWAWCRLLLLLLGLIAASVPAGGEDIGELWRSPFGNPRAVSIDTGSGACWAATGNSIVCVSRSDALQFQVDGFSSPLGLDVNPANGSCWVADTYNDQVAHVAADGTELWRGGVFSRPISVAVDPGDGSCWVADSGNGDLVRLAAGGTELTRLGGYAWPDPDAGAPVGGALAIDPAGGACWVADEGNGRLLRISASGAVLLESDVVPSPRAVSCNATDGSCWVADAAGGRVAHLASDGSVHWKGTQFASPLDVSANPIDGSCLVADAGSGYVLRVLSGGTELWRWGGDPRAVAVDPLDGSCWVANRQALGSVIGRYELAHVSAAGEAVARLGGFTRPVTVSVDYITGSCWLGDYESGTIARISSDHLLAVNRPEPSQYQPRSVSASGFDGSCWVAEEGGGLLHLSQEGVGLVRDGRYMVRCVSANPNDGSCWAGVMGGGTASDDEVYHFGADGAVLSHRPHFARVSSVCVNAADSSCWAADQDADLLVHLAHDGAEIGRFDVDSPRAVSVNASDGSVWVASADEQQGTSSVSHLSEEGTVLWSGDAFAQASSVAANPTDGSCWIADWGTWEIIHLAEDGAELGRVGGFRRSRVSVNPVDGSCWVCDEDNGQVVHLGVPGYEGPTFPDILCYQWCYDEVEACVDAGIVAGYIDGRYHWELAVARDQMAVYVSRAVAGGDANVDPPSGPPTFPDVPGDHWAFKYVEYAVVHNVVAGYPEGVYRPDLVVDRAQMAAYIARAAVDPTGDEGLSDYIPPPVATFSDVQPFHWAFLYVEYCVGEGIVHGYLDSKYHPEYQVTRDQMAVYVCRAFNLPY